MKTSGPDWLSLLLPWVVSLDIFEIYPQIMSKGKPFFLSSVIYSKQKNTRMQMMNPIIAVYPSETS